MDYRLEDAKKHIGEVYGDYTIIGLDRSNNKDKKLLYVCKCNICGHIQKRPIAEIKRTPIKHSMVSCREDYLKYYSDHCNSDYKYIGISDKRDNKRNAYLYDFKCKVCGNIISLPSDSYQRNIYKHSSFLCGEHVYLEELGNIYDDYKVIEYLGRRKKTDGEVPIYLCECQICHRQKIMQIGNIKQHKGTTHHACSLLLDRDNLPYLDRFERKWANLRTRTTNPNGRNYESYGGRGISSEAFKYFIDFFDTMYDSFLEHVKMYGIDNTTIERIDVDGDYCPENCRWATWEEQFSNKQDTVYFKTIDQCGNINYYRNLDAYCKEKGLEENRYNIFNRINNRVNLDELNGYKYKKVSKEEYEQNVSKISICQIVSDEDKEKYLKLLKEEMYNV